MNATPTEKLAHHGAKTGKPQAARGSRVVKKPGGDPTPPSLITTTDGQLRVHAPVDGKVTAFFRDPADRNRFKVGPHGRTYSPEEVLELVEVLALLIRVKYPPAQLADIFEVDEAAAARLGAAGCMAQAHPQCHPMEAFPALVAWVMDEFGDQGQEYIFVKRLGSQVKEDLARRASADGIRFHVEPDNSLWWYSPNGLKED